MKYLSLTGLSALVDKLKIIFATKNTVTVSLPSSGWTLTGGYYYKTASITGMVADDLIIVSPARGYEEIYANNSVMATAQAAGSITVRSKAAVAVNITILNLGTV